MAVRERKSPLVLPTAIFCFSSPLNLYSARSDFTGFINAALMA
ncbi:hypothetical protein FHS57_003456 [Runella defluvii]|uniref:Uncharacterized protein n=1 Tax=Runella defluvii TaxID=370973 RepID=A0A7W5ZLL5_9BACT|nr:hypothetical protein [Runella defluvii]